MHILTRVHRGLAWLTLAVLVLQVYLAGSGIFGATSFEPHRTVGYLLVLLVLLLLLMALVARSSRRVLGLSALLVTLAIVQVALVYLRASAPFVSALHAVNALALMGLTAAIARSAGEPAPAPSSAATVATAEA
jgi:hypothetical protein